MSDLERIQQCEQQLLSALGAATQAVEQLASTGHADGLQELCLRFQQDAKESQAVLLELADRYGTPLPYEQTSYVAKLRALAAAKQVEAALAQLEQVNAARHEAAAAAAQQAAAPR